MDRDLTRNEELALYGLVRYPELSNRELAVRLEMNESTLSTVKKRLEQSGMLTTIRAPNLCALGCELIVIISGKFLRSPESSDWQAKIEGVFGILEDAVYIQFDANNVFAILFTRNYTDAQRAIMSFEAANHQEGLLDENSLSYKYFSLRMASIWSYFDYSAILKSMFDIDEGKPIDPPHPFNNCCYPHPPHSAEIPRDAENSLNSGLRLKEIEILYGLVRYPEYSDSDLAQLMGIRRQTLSLVKRELEDKGLIKTLRIPDLCQLGYEIQMLAHMKYNPSADRSLRKVASNNAFYVFKPIMAISTDRETIAIAAFESFHKSQVMERKFFEMYDDVDFLLMAPETLPFSICNSILFRNHDYAPITAKLLGLKS